MTRNPKLETKKMKTYSMPDQLDDLLDDLLYDIQAGIVEADGNGIDGASRYYTLRDFGDGRFGLWTSLAMGVVESLEERDGTDWVVYCQEMLPGDDAEEYYPMQTDPQGWRMCPASLFDAGAVAYDQTEAYDLDLPEGWVRCSPSYSMDDVDSGRFDNFIEYEWDKIAASARLWIKRRLDPHYEPTDEELEALDDEDLPEGWVRRSPA